MVGGNVNNVLKGENLQEEPHIILQNLTRAEETLIEEKNKLEIKMKKLRSEIKNEIQNKMSNIQNLREEITNLKSSCDELSKSLKIIKSN